MPDFFAKRNYLILLGLIVISMTVFTIHVRESENGPIHKLQRMVITIAAPAQSLVTSIVSPLKDGWDYVVHFGQLARENRQLRKEVMDLKKQVSDLRSLKQENDHLRKLLAFKKERHYEGVVAQIVGMPSSNWWSSAIVNKGSTDGIKRGMPVVAGNILVGQVASASRHASKIVFINDAESGVSAQVKRTGEIGVIRGQIRSTKLLLNYISRDSNIRKGDVIYTSGLGGIFPRGILIGRVIKVKQPVYSLYKIVEVSSPVNFLSLNEVMIIMHEPGFEIEGE